MPGNTSNVIATQTNLVGNGTVSPDPLMEVNDRGLPAEQATYVFSIYGGNYYSVDIAFTAEYFAGGSSLGIVNVTNVTCDFDFAAHGITATKLNAYTYRLAGTYTNAFADEYYNFVLRDMSQQVLLPNTTVDFLALIQYHMPNPTTQRNTYNFTVTLPQAYGVPTPTEDKTFTMYQWIAWYYPPAVTNVQNLVARGV
jgi:hypothetical protein